MTSLKSSMSLKLLTYAFKTTLPVMFGYVPLGIAFGLMFSELGYHWIYSFLMSMFVFAGSAQFLAVGMLAVHESVLEIGIMTLILNSRQAFYGIPLIREFETKGWKKLYLIFTLSDEPFSLISSSDIPKTFNKQEAYLSFSLWMHFYWIFGCTLGALLSDALPFSLQGMEFALTALFIVLAVDQIKKAKEIQSFFVALSIGIVCLLCFERTHMLISSIALSLSYLLIQGKKDQWR